LGLVSFLKSRKTFSFVTIILVRLEETKKQKHTHTHRMYGGFIPSSQLSLTQTQLGALREYTGGGSLWLNKYLNRYDHDGDKKKGQEQLQRHSKTG
jgi:hypothetical protein